MTRMASFFRESASESTTPRKLIRGSSIPTRENQAQEFTNPQRAISTWESGWTIFSMARESTSNLIIKGMRGRCSRGKCKEKVYITIWMEGSTKASGQKATKKDLGSRKDLIHTKGSGSEI